MRLVRLGFRQGDFLAASLPFLTDHIFLEYACFRIGVIHAPLDPRLRPAEVLRCSGADPRQGIRFPRPRRRPRTSASGAGLKQATARSVQHSSSFPPHARRPSTAL